MSEFEWVCLILLQKQVWSWVNSKHGSELVNSCNFMNQLVSLIIMRGGVIRCNAVFIWLNTGLPPSTTDNTAFGYPFTKLIPLVETIDFFHGFLNHSSFLFSTFQFFQYAYLKSCSPLCFLFAICDKDWQNNDFFNYYYCIWG